MSIDLTEKCKLEHSFSDVSHFNINTRCSVNTTRNLRDLRADFVHLYGVQLHSNESSPAPVLDTQHMHEEKEGFQLRRIQRSMSMLGSTTNSTSSSSEPTKIAVVVVPFVDLDRKELKRLCSCMECYEDRQLYHLLLANDPAVRIIYLSSSNVDEAVVGYYLGLSRNDSGSDEQQNRPSNVHDMLTRVFMVSVPSKEGHGKNTPFNVVDKILEDTNLIEYLKDLIHQREGSSPTDSAGLCVFTGSDSMSKLSTQLGVRLLESSGDHLHFGTKQGSREVFAACGIPHPAGTPCIEDDDLLTCGDRHDEEVASWAHNQRYIRSSHSLAIGIARQILLHGVHPKRWMIKLNQSFSGKGNASIDLTKFQDCPVSSTTEDAEKEVLSLATKIEAEFERNMKFEDPSMSWYGNEKHVGFQTQIERLGVIAEVFVEGEVPTSPSVQAVIEPNDIKAGGSVSIVSTHEQKLYGQVYTGCVNPASEQYRPNIMDIGLKIGKYLAAQGVIGHFSCDFIATQKPDGSCNLNAIEINLRQGGTTHPHATMALLCGGCICSDGVFRTNENEVRTYVATDCHSLTPCSESHLIDAINSKNDPQASKIRWNKDERVGVVFHLFKFAPRGRIGFTAIGRNMTEAQLLFDEAEQFLAQIK